MTKSEQAMSKFAEGYNCAQSVFNAFCEDLGIEPDKALKIAGGFGGGMGRKGEVCGAVTGALMVLGVRYGRGEKEADTARDIAYGRTRELMDEFARKHGSYLCRTLLNDCDLTTAEGRKFFAENDLSSKVCKPCVQSAVEILETML